MVVRRIYLLGVCFLFVSVAVSFPLSRGDLNARSTRHENPSDSLNIGNVERQVDSEGNAERGSASPSSSNGNSDFLSKHPHHDDRNHSKRSLMDLLKIALASSQALSASETKDGVSSSASLSAGSAVHISNHIKDKSKPPNQSHKENEPIEVKDTTPHTEDDIHGKVPPPLSPPATKEEPVGEQASKEIPDRPNGKPVETPEVTTQEHIAPTEDVPDVLTVTEKLTQTTLKVPTMEDLGLDIDFISELFM